MKKIIAILSSVMLISVLLITTLTTSAAQIKKGKFEIANVSANPGDTVIVPITFNENPGIMAVTINFTYDSNVLEYVKYHKGTVISDYGVKAFPDENRIRFVCCQNSNDSVNNGTFISFEFKVKNGAKAGLSKIDINYTKGDFCNKNLDRIMPSVTSGGVNVQFTGSNCDHSEYSDWEKVAEPTCETDGIEQRYCLNCGHVESGSIEKTGHYYEDNWTVEVAATKDKDGTLIRYCVFCQHAQRKNYTYQETGDDKIPNTKDSAVSNDVVTIILGETKKAKEEEFDATKEIDSFIENVNPDLQLEGDVSITEKIEESYPALEKIILFFEKAFLVLFGLFLV